jgi:hypothetical protein
VRVGKPGAQGDRDVAGSKKVGEKEWELNGGNEVTEAVAINLPNKALTHLPGNIVNEGSAYILRTHLSILPGPIPGFYDASSISKHQILSIIRVKNHLKHCTFKPVTLCFLDKHKANFAEDGLQFVDADPLIAVSPFYARIAWQDSNNTSIFVPKHLAARMVNVFIQTISPVSATELPTHHLWQPGSLAPDVYDPFGAFTAEMIAWTIETLFDLLFFARQVEVSWMVNRKLHDLSSHHRRCRIFSPTQMLGISTPPRGRLFACGTTTTITITHIMLPKHAIAPTDLPTSSAACTLRVPSKSSLHSLTASLQPAA